MVEKVFVLRLGTSGGDRKSWYSDPVEMIEWLSANGYKAKRASKTLDGKRVCVFEKPGCETRYTIYC